jgi:hypothetical protein
MKPHLCFNKIFRENLRLCLLCVLLTGAVGLKAQPFTYALSILSGTYTPITGTAITELYSGADDEISGLKPIGFTFFYGVTCIGYTQFAVSSNGWLTFNTGAVSSDPTNDLSANTTIRPGLAPLWDDLALNYGSPPCSYTTTGSSPNRVTTIQWKQASWKITGASPGQMSFQISLFESTGVIQFQYHQETGALASPSASIGLAAVATGSGNFYSMDGTLSTASNTVNTTTISIKPTEGIIYQWTPNCSTMPIELLSFDGKNSGGQNVLSWSTETETDNAFFVVERSSDGTVFSELGRVNGAGNSLIKKEYAYSDHETQPGMTYYRLKQTDFNGQYTYSRIIAVLNRLDVQMSHIFPNPTDGQANFNLYSPTAGTLHTSLVDNCGAELYKTDLAIAEGDNVLSLKTDIPPGTYLLRASLEALDFFTTRKVIVK